MEVLSNSLRKEGMQLGPSRYGRHQWKLIRVDGYALNLDTGLAANKQLEKTH